MTVSYICSSINTSLYVQQLPLIRKSANTTPIPKMSKAKDINTNLRSIFLTPNISKIA